MIARLPKVLWQHIASWLQGHDAIIRLRATCRWLRRVEIHQLPRHMEYRLTMERMQSITSIRRLNISGCKNVTNEMMQCCTRLEWLDASRTKVTWFPPTLRHLDIFDRNDVTNEMLQHCTLLEWLDASWTNVTWFPSTLRYVSIIGNKIDKNQIATIMQSCIEKN